MKSLPLTDAGKIDLDALAAPGESDGALGFGTVAPRDFVEMKLARILVGCAGRSRRGRS